MDKKESIMNQAYVAKISDMVKKMQEPFEAMARLNVKTLQSYLYLKPEDISIITKPEDLLEKGVELTVSNGHKTLDYVQDMFHIMKRLWLNISDTTIKNTQATMSDAVTATERTANYMKGKSNQSKQTIKGTNGKSKSISIDTKSDGQKKSPKKSASSSRTSSSLNEVSKKMSAIHLPETAEKNSKEM